MKRLSSHLLQGHCFGMAQESSDFDENVSFQHSPELPLVLKDLDLTIQPGEKVGVVGRTKSSLFSVLYQLAEPSGVIIPSMV